MHDEQLALSPALDNQGKGARIRTYLNRAIVANGLSHAELARDTGIDEKQIGRCLREKGGAHLPAALLAAILAKDEKGIILVGIAGMFGWEAKPKTPDLADENRRLREQLARLRAALEEP